MQRLVVSGAVRPLQWSLGVKRLMDAGPIFMFNLPEWTRETDTVQGTIFSNSVLFVSASKNVTNSYNYNTPEVINPPYCEFNKP